jgi:hypothetical protein
MARLASSGEPNRSNNFLSTKTTVSADRLQQLLASLDAKTRDTIQALAKAPKDVRDGVLASLDADTRAALGPILDQLA